MRDEARERIRDKREREGGREGQRSTEGERGGGLDEG